jgi:hypothetical protein
VAQTNGETTAAKTAEKEESKMGKDITNIALTVIAVALIVIALG